MISLTAFNMIKAGAETNTRVFTPQKIVKEMLDALPPEVWNSKTTFLDPAVKSGVYLVEIYNRLMETPELIKDFPDEQDRAIHIYKNQLFGIAIDNFCCLMAQRNLYGHIGGESNIRFIDGYMSKVKDKDSKRYIDAVKKEFGMKKFGVIIGNPPYSEESGGGGRTARQGATLYHKFVEKSIDTADVVCMITKNNWLSSDTLCETRSRMIDTGIIEIKNYPIYEEIFKGISVSVSSFVIMNNYKGVTKYKEIRNGKIETEYSLDLHGMPCVPECKELAGILRKVKSNKFFSNFVYSKMPFGIASDGKIGATGKGDYIDSNLVKTDYYNTPILFNDGFSYIHDNDIPKNAHIRMNYKVACGQQLRHDEKVIYNLKYLDAGTITSQSFAILFDSSNKVEAYNVYKYMHTKFARIVVRSITDEICTTSPIRFKILPVLDFASNSDIDWSQSIADIDKQLYKKYNLTDEEIDYIEKTIKPMT